MSSQGIRIAIDRGGTFTDAWAEIPGRDEHLVFKILSVCPDEYADAPTECIRQILENALEKTIPKGSLLDLEPIESVRMGTTVATNALLERKGDRVAFLATKGFRDILLIGNQTRPDLFDLSVRRLEQLYETVVEVDERVTIEGASEAPSDGAIDVESDDALVVGQTGEVVRIMKKPDLDAVRIDLERLKEQGFKNIAIGLMHSYTYPEHELQVTKLAEEMGFKVSASSVLQSMAKYVPRSQSAVADAYLTPMTMAYLDGFRKNFKGQLEDESANKLLICQSDGGLTSWSKFTGLRGVLSGPAGGVVGLARTCYDDADGTPVLGFDMGGTSTDVARYSGALEHIFESTIAEVTIQTPQLDINTVAAGGGSILAWENGLLKVGPSSAGANPGPACYGRGGPLTVTDANFLLGRIIPDFFPRRLDHEIVREKFASLTETVNKEKDGGEPFTPETLALGFLAIANATMTRPIRTLSEGRGYGASSHNLGSFGGAGGQHAVFIARDLGIKRAIIPCYSSILSAYGMALADVVVENQEPSAITFSEQVVPEIKARLESLSSKGSQGLVAQGFDAASTEHEYFLNMRYQGSDTSLMISVSENVSDAGVAFTQRHTQEFGFSQSRNILIDDVRVRSVGKSRVLNISSPFEELKKYKSDGLTPVPTPIFTRKIFFENHGWTETPVYELKSMSPGVHITGPAMIIDKTQTIVVDHLSKGVILPEHVILEVDKAEKQNVATETVDPVTLSVFGHRFMTVAEQMGHTMEKTSISVNIKERLDYSCAIFSADGGLVANAPHVPSHLGSMSTAIAYQAQRYKAGELKPGDVIISNHPQAGGTHLPDITTITPVFDDEENPKEIIFFVANRGHHADIGGIVPGSMPPNSTELWQEGAAIESFKMIDQGVFDEAGLIKHLYDEPASFPGCSGTRTLTENIADLKAAVASNQKGIELIRSLIKEFTWPVVQLYMHAIQDNAAQSVRDLLKQFAAKYEGGVLEATEYNDDGIPFKLKVTIDKETGEAVFDFTGTGPEHSGNLNAPPTCSYSVIMYCLRSMISTDIPLNQGCLKPIKVICPDNTILSPSPTAATVGCTTETSQKVADLVLRAFNAAAASQGTMNNLSFGCGGTDPVTGEVTKGFGYYETICGGAGAGLGWNGASAVHTHMTNTRITDPEILEKRYPVILHEFSIRANSGGDGKWRGGNGCIREMEFRMPLQVSVLTDRRVTAPYGLEGGGEGQRGQNIWVRKDPVTGTTRQVSLGPRKTSHFGVGDRVIIMTPGGGGYGRVGDEDVVDVKERDGRSFLTNGSLGVRHSIATGN
ncbi:Hydantoinase B/oxoprolinase-domain-containing protein [Fusarium flagelliforme]|uniref:Hydantoinase B/oxoprolinase-domain-containing protein n=1 Tax=Fusarium flagelliforme TaxID=2675880 RepID=UPI001E8D2BAF|nr:Hydantoinase B/oxoprolinase-domain-containing protein [Fusarium flagelliforme]KAH7182460.1 Hydantoinase B/oxoprolinase-domain-containing protein [Fusarium flagelliforme]